LIAFGVQRGIVEIMKIIKKKRKKKKEMEKCLIISLCLVMGVLKPLPSIKK